MSHLLKRRASRSLKCWGNGVLQDLCRAGGEFYDCWIAGKYRGGCRTARTIGLGAFLGTPGNGYVQ